MSVLTTLRAGGALRAPMSRSTRGDDDGRTMQAYADGGADWYWIVDPERQALTTYQLRGGRYVETRRYPGADVAHVESPIVVAVDLTTLFR